MSEVAHIREKSVLIACAAKSFTCEDQAEVNGYIAALQKQGVLVYTASAPSPEDIAKMDEIHIWWDGDGEQMKALNKLNEAAGSKKIVLINEPGVKPGSFYVVKEEVEAVTA